MFNRVILIGRLTRDPELKYTPQGTAVATFTLAVDRKFKKGEADFINIVVWQNQAENVAQYLSKGRLTAVEGRLQIRSYEKDGQKHWMTEVVADDVRFLGTGGGNASGGFASESPRGDASPASDWESLGREVRVDEIDVVGSQENDDLPF